MVTHILQSKLHTTSAVAQSMGHREECVRRVPYTDDEAGSASSAAFSTNVQVRSPAELENKQTRNFVKQLKKFAHTTLSLVCRPGCLYRRYVHNVKDVIEFWPLLRCVCSAGLLLTVIVPRQDVLRSHCRLAGKTQLQDLP